MPEDRKDDILEQLKEAVAQKVEMRGGCLVWTGAVNHRGRGIVWRKHLCYQVSRIAWYLLRRDEPPGRIGTSCKNPLCVSHMVAEKQRRGRKLSGKMIGALKEAHELGLTIRDLARMAKVSPATVFRALGGRK